VDDTGTSPSVLDSIARALQRFLAGLEGPRVDFGLVWPLLGILGAAIIFFVVATLGRGLGERVRTEVALREAVGAERPDPSRHLRAADDALAAGRPREAIHALYLFALTALVAREAIRWDPALTDRELLIRAAGVRPVRARRVDGVGAVHPRRDRGDDAGRCPEREEVRFGGWHRSRRDGRRDLRTAAPRRVRRPHQRVRQPGHASALRPGLRGSTGAFAQRRSRRFAVARPEGTRACDRWSYHDR